MKPIILAAVATVTLSGCAGSLPTMSGSGEPTVVTGLPLGEAPAQRLAPGQCALALWTRTEPAVRVVVAVSQPAQAHIRLDGRDLVLPRVSSDGEPIYGHAPNQTWSRDGVTLSLTATLAPRDGMVGGAVAQDAMLVLTQATGEEIIIPAAGLLACQG